MLLDRVDSETLGTLMAQLPAEYREVLILREIEDLSYKDIAAITVIPAGTGDVALVACPVGAAQGVDQQREESHEPR